MTPAIYFALGAAMSAILCVYALLFHGKKRSAKPLEAYLESMTDRIVLLDDELRQVQVYGKLLGEASPEPENFRGKTAAEIIGSEGARIHEEAARKAIAGEILTYDWSWETPDRGIVWIQTRVGPIRNAGPKGPKVVSVSRDVTELKKSQFALLTSEKQFNSIFHASPVSTVLSSLTSGKILDVNDSFMRLTGYTRRETIGKRATDLDLWADPHIKERVGPILRELGSFDHLENRIRTKAGEIRDTLASLTLVELGGETFIVRMDYDITERKQYEDALKTGEETQKQLFNSFISAMAAALDARDGITGGHSHRVTEYAMGIGRAMGLSDSRIERIRLAGMVHDMGKINTPDSILKKPDILTREEFGIIKQHAAYTRSIIRNLRLPHDLDGLADDAGLHHERLDGSGYPDGLKGDSIPQIARILAVADVFDAITSKRHYRDAMPIQQAIEEIKKGKGNHFFPECVEAFLKYYESDLAKKFSGSKGYRNW